MIRLHSTGLNDATILSNIFIDRFMTKANGEFVKVYIYLLRMLGRPEEAFGLSKMADSLFCTEGDILRALKYWESEKLVILLYEEAELTGITFTNSPFAFGIKRSIKILDKIPAKNLLFSFKKGCAIMQTQ